MTDITCQPLPSLASDPGQTGRLLRAARRLFADRGPSVTLGEIAAAAASDEGGESRCFELVELLLGQRLGDLLEIARARPARQSEPVPGPRGVSWASTERCAKRAPRDHSPRQRR